MNAYAHIYKASLEGIEYTLTLHVVALGGGKFAETLSIAYAKTMEPLDIYGHMGGDEWGFAKLPERIRELVATAYAYDHSPYVADEERVRSLAGQVDYIEVKGHCGALGRVEG